MIPTRSRRRCALGLGLALTALAPAASAQPTTEVVGRPCRDDEVPYFAAGCDGPARRQCWNAAVHPMPMSFCGCDGRTSSAPLPGGGRRWRHTGPCTPSPAAVLDDGPPPPAATRADVPGWLARCAVAGRNGLNPQLPVPPGLAAVGRDLLLAAAARAPRDPRRCAVWALSRHAPPRELHAFWRAQLTASRDAQVRFEALLALATLADPADLDLALQQYVHPALRPVLANRLRDWHDRRAVPALIALLDDRAAEANQRNALRSIELLGFVPAQAADPDPTHAAPGAHVETMVAPYRRWWEREGRAAFAREQAAWARLLATTRAVPLEPDWSAQARSLETPAR
jgi:hypothetical protein